MRIGYRPVTTEVIDALPGLNTAPPIRLVGLPITLDTVRVASRSSCDASREPGFATIWDQARTALTAAQVTAASRGLTATVMTYERTLDPRTRRVREQNASVATGFVTQPWRTVSPAILHREGYVATDDSGWVVYRAPGIGALMSDAFVEDHCFEVKRSRDGEVAIEFSPTRERREIPEINGTIWLDARSAELHVYTAEDGAALLEGTGLDPELGKTLEGKFMSGFVRATKPGKARELPKAASRACGCSDDCCS